MPDQAPVLQIVEVLGPSVQGQARPFLCRGADGLLYYVKGQQTNRTSLWREWICAHLGQAMGLPIPPFCLVQLDEDLVRELPPDWRHLGSLPSFGSRRCANASWMELGMAGQVAKVLQCDILVFDWWVHNTDRTRGNPNLLWDGGQQAVAVIDHNNALDPGFVAADFLADHLFSEQWVGVTEDLVTRAHYERRLCEALPAADLACRTAPEAWLWENSEFDIPARFDRDAALALLARCASSELWRTV